MNQLIIGIDEAGRGCLCGPVVVAGVHLPEGFEVKGVRDSKKILSEKRREELYEKIISYPGVLYHIERIEPEEIDRLNILGATMKGMSICAKNVTEKLVNTDSKNNTLSRIIIKIDGNRKPTDLDPNIKSETIVKGDSKILEISAASILAKVARDRIMNDYSKIYPGWDFDKNKGYPNKQHMDKINSERKWTDIHRKSFNPVKSLMKNI